MIVESQAITPRLVTGVAKKAVIMVCTESQVNWFGFVTLTTPVSAGLQEAVVAKVESDGNKVVVMVCTESQVNWLGFVTLTTPVSVGLQEVIVAKVESEVLIMML